MFRLIQLHTRHGVPRIGVDIDGYVSEHAALARYRETPAGFFGVGRFDDRGQLREVIVDTRCGALGECPGPAVVVHAETFLKLCDACASGRNVLTVPELETRLGVTVQVSTAPAGRPKPVPAERATDRIARELRARAGDPAWRDALCAELDRHPERVRGLVAGVGALGHRDVLDLYPALFDLGARLPLPVRDDLVRATTRPLSPAAKAARRMGL